MTNEVEKLELEMRSLSRIGNWRKRDRISEKILMELKQFIESTRNVQKSVEKQTVNH